MAKGQDVERAIDVGERALALAAADGAALADRVPTGTFDTIRTDLGTASGAKPAVLTSRADVSVATRNEREAAKQGAEFFSRVRDRIRETALGAAAKKAWGVGAVVRPGSTAGVIAALQTIVDRATAKPEEASAAGVTAGDIERARGYVAALGGADTAQRNRRRAAVGTTATRDGAVGRLLTNARVVAAAGALHHHGNAAKVKAYDALRDAAARPGRKKRTTDPAPAS